MNKFMGIALLVLILAGVGFYFFNSNNPGLPSLVGSSNDNMQPPALPE